MPILTALGTTFEGIDASLILYVPLVVWQLSAFVGVAIYESRKHVGNDILVGRVRSRNNRNRRSMAVEKTGTK